MNQEKHLIYTQKVNLVVIIIYWTIVTLYFISNLMAGMGWERLLEVILLASLLLLLPTILLLKKVSPYMVRSFVYGIITLYLYYNILRADGFGNFRGLFIFFQALIIMALYMEKNHLLTFALITSLCNSLIYLFFPQLLDPIDLPSFLQFMVAYIGSTLLLYYMSLWGHEMLQNSEECWRYALKGSGDGIWDWNLADGIIFHSHTLLQLISSENSPIGEYRLDDLGRYMKLAGDPLELVASRIHEWERIIHPQDVKEAIKALQDHLQGMTPSYEAEFRIMKEDRSYRWIHDRGRVIIRHKKGTPLRVVGTSTDITKRKRNEEQLNLYMEELKKAHGKIKEDIITARRLHQQFLPSKLPQISGYSFATYYQPAKDLGGDFYNIIYRIYQLKERVLFYLADVSGHGLDGALLNIFLRETINSYLITHQENPPFSPAHILRYVAKQYHMEFFPDDYFICLTIGILHIPTNTLTYSGAGFQIPPLVITPEGEYLHLKFGGLPISKAVDLELLNDEEETFSLLPGSCCLFTTDGMIEEEKGEEQYGITRLKKVLKEHRIYKTQEILSAINKDFCQFTGNHQGHDDITCILIKALDHGK